MKLDYIVRRADELRTAAKSREDMDQSMGIYYWQDCVRALERSKAYATNYLGDLIVKVAHDKVSASVICDFTPDSAKRLRRDLDAEKIPYNLKFTVGNKGINPDWCIFYDQKDSFRVRELARKALQRQEIIRPHTYTRTKEWER